MIRNLGVNDNLGDAALVNGVVSRNLALVVSIERRWVRSSIVLSNTSAAELTCFRSTCAVLLLRSVSCARENWPLRDKLCLVSAALVLAGGIVNLAELLREGQLSNNTVIAASTRAVLSIGAGLSAC